MNNRQLVIGNRLLVIRERVKSLTDDNYQIIVQSYNSTMTIVRLRHRTNGNEIKIKAMIMQNWLCQWTNGKLVHEGKIIPD